MRQGKHITEFSKEERKKLAKNNTVIIRIEVDKIIEKKLKEKKTELGFKNLMLQIIDTDKIKLYPWFSAELENVLTSLEERKTKLEMTDEETIRRAKEVLSLLQKLTKNSIKLNLITNNDVFKIEFKIVWETAFMAEIDLPKMIKEIEKHTNEYETKKIIRELRFKSMYGEIDNRNLIVPILVNFVNEKNGEMEELENFILKELKKIKEKMVLYLKNNVTTDSVTFYEERKDILFDEEGIAFIKN